MEAGERKSNTRHQFENKVEWGEKIGHSIGNVRGKNSFFFLLLLPLKGHISFLLFEPSLILGKFFFLCFKSPVLLKYLFPGEVTPFLFLSFF